MTFYLLSVSPRFILVIDSRDLSSDKDTLIVGFRNSQVIRLET